MAIHGLPSIVASPPTPPLLPVEDQAQVSGDRHRSQSRTISTSMLGNALHLEMSCPGSMVKQP